MTAIISLFRRMFGSLRILGFLRVAIVLSCLAESGCMYGLAAKAALSVAGGVVRAVSKPATDNGTPLPQDRNALLDAYRECLRRKAIMPSIDCSRYQHALE